VRKLLELIHNSPRRNKYEIYAEILDLCTQDKIHLSFIIRELRLQTQKCKEYLVFLVSRGLLSLIETEINDFIYVTTEKGRDGVKEFLSVLDQYFS